MGILQKFQIIAQMIGVAGLLITLVINYRQVRLVNRQMHEMRRSTTAQHILTLLNFIESDEIRAALNLVYTTLHKTHFTDWTEYQRRNGNALCLARCLFSRDTNRCDRDLPGDLCNSVGGPRCNRQI